MAAIQVFLNDCIDYAGLFPPSSESMQQAVQNFSQYRRSKHAWALGRLIVPVDRLHEFLASFHDLSPADNGVEKPWRLSCLWPKGLVESTLSVKSAVAAMHQAETDANRDSRCNIVLDTVEAVCENAEQIRRFDEFLPVPCRGFAEVPTDERRDGCLDALADVPRICGKLRTGGVTPEAIPSVERVANFLASAVQRRVPFKCTAGLHHPLPATRPLTYQPDAPIGKMHGFWNVGLATGLLMQNTIDALIAQTLLADEQAKSFDVRDDVVQWAEHLLTAEQFADVRRRGFVSFGSCSFREPIDDLLQLGWLHDSADQSKE